MDSEKRVFGRKLKKTQRPQQFDRFVTSRESIADIRDRHFWAGCNNHTVDIWQSKHQQQKKYKHYLDWALGLEHLNTKESRRTSIDSERAWPCVPRTKKHLSSADSILDLPTYGDAAFPELLDWSHKNLLVAALGRKYHMFSWQKQDVIAQGGSLYQILCCKFDPQGDGLLIGTDMGTVELHNGPWSMWMGSGNCECPVIKFGTDCSVTAVDWSPTGNSFVIGCSAGAVTTFDRDMMRLERWQCPSKEPVLAVKVSPDTRYVAVALINSPLIHVLAWPFLEYHEGLTSDWTINTIHWHPWRSALLTIGAVGQTDKQTTLGFWDAPAARFKDFNLGTSRYVLDTMLFSHRTGELVLSLWDPERELTHPKTCSQLLVMSDPYNVVDQSGEEKNGLDRVRTMVFSPDGSKLATATSDEDLIIWNFLPEDQKKKTTNPRRFSAIPSYIDRVTYGYFLR